MEEKSVVSSPMGKKESIILTDPALHSPCNHLPKDSSNIPEVSLECLSPTNLSSNKVTGSRDKLAFENEEMNEKNIFIIGISGGSASGKTSVSQRLIENLNVPWVILISMDSFYRVLTKEQSAKAVVNEYNFDHPDAFDFPLLYKSLKRLKKGRPVEIPIYDFTLHARRKETELVYGASVIIFEGILAFYDKDVRSLMDMKIFVDSDPDTRLARRMIRDIAERGRDFKGILEQYNRFVKPAFDDFIQPTVRHADIIIPRGLDNTVAIDVITKHIARQLEERKIQMLEHSSVSNIFPKGLIVLNPTHELKAIHTIIRDEKTEREDFVFYIQRLAMLAIERALNDLHYTPKSVTTPSEVSYHGLFFNTKLCAVSIASASEPMNEALRKIARNVAFGHLAIESDPETHAAQLQSSMLPKDIASCHVVLMDISLATGTSFLLAIRTLLECGVPEDRIILVTLIAAPTGINAVSIAHPKIKMITTEMDAKLNDNYHILPGLGNFYQRYFGCNGC